MLFQLEITERKHAKDEKQQVNFSTTAPIIYGKINFFYPVKLGVQKQFLFGNKGNKNGVSITGNVGGGFIAGLLRPYMVEVNKNGQRTFVSLIRQTVPFISCNHLHSLAGQTFKQVEIPESNSRLLCKTCAPV